MAIKNVIKAVGLTAALAAFGGVAMAEDGKSSATAKWKAKASNAVSYEMEYPRVLARRSLQPAHNIVDLRIDHEGNVLRSSLYQSSGSVIFDHASERFADRIDKLPSLPSGYYENGAFVRVHLLYAQSESELKSLIRTVTRTEQIARQQNNDANDVVASIPQIDLFAGGN